MSTLPGRSVAADPQVERFNLVQRFTLAALLAGIAVTVSASFSLSAFLTKRMIEQEAGLTAAFVRSIVATEEAYHIFKSGMPADGDTVPPIFTHLAQMPDVARTNIYTPEGLMLWSSDPTLIGRRFPENPELQQALLADMVVHSGVVDRSKLPKSEHRNLDAGIEYFVETYTPVFDPETRAVIGVVELYRIPDELFAVVHAGEYFIWTAASLTAIFLFVAFSGIVAKAQRLIERQHEQLVEREGLAVVGEMGTAVAHGLRNPLASIRSSAEVSLGCELPPDARECANDIIAQVDRLEGWIRRLLTYAKPSQTTLGPVDVGGVLRESAEDYRRDLERRGIALSVFVPDDLPPVLGEAGILGQLVNSVIANASEAIRGSGKIFLRARREDDDVLLEVVDDGPGLAKGDLKKAFKPFYTSKQRGLGLGLPLVKRVIERFGGRVVLENIEPHGLLVRIILPIHSQGVET